MNTFLQIMAGPIPMSEEARRVSRIIKHDMPGTDKPQHSMPSKSTQDKVLAWAKKCKGEFMAKEASEGSGFSKRPTYEALYRMKDFGIVDSRRIGKIILWRVI